MAGAAPLFLALCFSSGTLRDRSAAAVGRLIAGVVGAFPLLNIWENIQQRRGSLEVLTAGWVVAGGVAVVLISGMLDLMFRRSVATHSPSDPDAEEQALVSK